MNTAGVIIIAIGILVTGIGGAACGITLMHMWNATEVSDEALGVAAEPFIGNLVTVGIGWVIVLVGAVVKAFGKPAGA